MGQLILAVDGHRVEGLQHQDVARLIAESFAQRDKPVRANFVGVTHTTKEFPAIFFLLICNALS